nr:hypothetical protein [uncultured Roseibium sp.]
MARFLPHGKIRDGGPSCLTEMSVAALAAGAVVLSGLFWLLILAVL